MRFAAQKRILRSFRFFEFGIAPYCIGVDFG